VEYVGGRGGGLIEGEPALKKKKQTWVKRSHWSLKKKGVWWFVSREIAVRGKKRSRGRSYKVYLRFGKEMSSIQSERGALGGGASGFR